MAAGKIVLRCAISRKSGDILAECPVDGWCRCRDDRTEQVTKCDQYHGSLFTSEGMRVQCGMPDQEPV